MWERGSKHNSISNLIKQQTRLFKSGFKKWWKVCQDYSKLVLKCGGRCVKIIQKWFFKKNG